MENAFLVDLTSRNQSLRKQLCLAVSVLCLSAPVAAQAAAQPTSVSPVPELLQEFVTPPGKLTEKSKMAFDNVYALNDEMFNIYQTSQNIYKQNFLAHNNLIMALFSGAGGRFILYRPGQPPLEADSPSPVYRLAKSVGHCGMATYELVAPYVNNPSDPAWLGEMKTYRVRVQTAMDSLNALDLKAEDRELLRDGLKQIAAFQDSCLRKGSFTYDELQSFARGFKSEAAKLIEVATAEQVGHWFKVMEKWKQTLGKDWDKTYALSNTIYVARQNNILFSVLVQFFGEKAINDRLLLLETTDFTATPDSMMDAFMRILTDRGIGEVFFKTPRLMDYELLGGGGRHAIEAEAAKRGLKPILPPLVPYNSNEWPMKIDPKSGTGPSTLEEIH
jgi:hypothetical protein